MALHSHNYGSASALPRLRHLGRLAWARHGRGATLGVPLDVALSALPSLPRPLLSRLVANMIEVLDEQDGDPDLEPTGDEFEDDDPAECNGDREPDCVEARTAYVAARVRKVPTIHFMQRGGRRWRIENL